MDTLINITPLEWVFLIVSFVSGVILSPFLLSSLFQSAKEKKLKQTLYQLENELYRYKQDVNQHFSQTAKLIAQMTGDFYKLHQHFCLNADTLCTDQQIAEDVQLTLQTPDKDDSQKKISKQKKSICQPIDYVLDENEENAPNKTVH